MSIFAIHFCEWVREIPSKLIPGHAILNIFHILPKNVIVINAALFTINLWLHVNFRPQGHSCKFFQHTNQKKKIRISDSKYSISYPYTISLSQSIFLFQYIKPLNTLIKRKENYKTYSLFVWEINQVRNLRLTVVCDNVFLSIVNIIDCLDLILFTLDIFSHSFCDTIDQVQNHLIWIICYDWRK